MEDTLVRLEREKVVAFADHFKRASGGSAGNILESLMCTYGTHMQRGAFGMSTTQAWADSEFTKALRSSDLAAELVNNGQANDLACAIRELSTRMKNYVGVLLTRSTTTHGADAINTDALKMWINKNIASDNAQVASDANATLDALVTHWRDYSQYLVNTSNVSDTALLHDAKYAELSRTFTNDARRLGELFDAHVQARRSGVVATNGAVHFLSALPRIEAYPMTSYGGIKEELLRRNYDPAGEFRGYDNQTVGTQRSFRAVYLQVVDIMFRVFDHAFKGEIDKGNDTIALGIEIHRNVGRLYFQEVARKYAVGSEQRRRHTAIANALLGDDDEKTVVTLLPDKDGVKERYLQLAKQLKTTTDDIEKLIDTEVGEAKRLKRRVLPQRMFDALDTYYWKMRDIAYAIGAIMDEHILHQVIPGIAAAMPQTTFDSDVGVALNKNRTSAAAGSIASKWLDKHPLAKRADVTWFLPSDEALKSYFAPKQLRFLESGSKKALLVRNELLDTCYFAKRLTYNDLQAACRKQTRMREEPGRDKKVIDVVLESPPPPAYTNVENSRWTFTCASLQETFVRSEQFFLSSEDTAGTSQADSVKLLLPVTREAAVIGFDSYNATGTLASVPEALPIVHLVDTVLYPRILSVDGADTGKVLAGIQLANHEIALRWLAATNDTIGYMKSSLLLPMIVSNAVLIKAFEYSHATREYFMRLDSTNDARSNKLRDEFFSWNLAVGTSTSLVRSSFDKQSGKGERAISHASKLYTTNVVRRLTSRAEVATLTAGDVAVVSHRDIDDSVYARRVDAVINKGGFVPRESDSRGVPYICVVSTLHPLSIVPKDDDSLLYAIVQDWHAEEARSVFDGSDDSSVSKSRKAVAAPPAAATTPRKDKAKVTTKPQSSSGSNDVPSEEESSFPKGRRGFARVVVAHSMPLDAFDIGDEFGHLNDADVAWLSAMQASTRALDVASFNDELTKAMSRVVGAAASDKKKATVASPWSYELDALSRMRINPNRAVIVLPDVYWDELFAQAAPRGQLDKFKSDMRKTSYARSVFSWRVVNTKCRTAEELRQNFQQRHAPNLAVAVTNWHPHRQLLEVCFVLSDGNMETARYFTLEELRLGENRPNVWLATYKPELDLSLKDNVLFKTKLFSAVYHSHGKEPPFWPKRASNATEPSGGGGKLTFEIATKLLKASGLRDTQNYTLFVPADQYALKLPTGEARAFDKSDSNDARLSKLQLDYLLKNKAAAYKFISAHIALRQDVSVPLDAETLRAQYSGMVMRVAGTTAMAPRHALATLDTLAEVYALSESKTLMGRTEIVAIARKPLGLPEQPPVYAMTTQLNARTDANKSIVHLLDSWLISTTGLGPFAAALPAAASVACNYPQLRERDVSCTLMRKLIVASGVLDECVRSANQYYTLFVPSDAYVTANVGLEKLDSLLLPSEHDVLVRLVNSHLVLNSQRFSVHGLHALASGKTELTTRDGTSLLVSALGNTLYVGRASAPPVRIVYTMAEWHPFGYVYIIDGKL